MINEMAAQMEIATRHDRLITEAADYRRTRLARRTTSAGKAKAAPARVIRLTAPLRRSTHRRAA